MFSGNNDNCNNKHTEQKESEDQTQTKNYIRMPTFPKSQQMSNFTMSQKNNNYDMISLNPTNNSMFPRPFSLSFAKQFIPRKIETTTNDIDYTNMLPPPLEAFDPLTESTTNIDIKNSNKINNNNNNNSNTINNLQQLTLPPQPLHTISNIVFCNNRSQQQKRNTHHNTQNTENDRDSCKQASIDSCFVFQFYFFCVYEMFGLF